MSNTAETLSSRVIARAVREGIGYGILAGSIFALAQVAVAVHVGDPASEPFRQLAALALGAETPAVQAEVATVFGAFVVVVLSGLFGLGFGLASLAEPAALRRRLGVQLALGAGYGFFLWLVDDVLVAPLASPWQLALHVACFGAPLGLMYAASERAAFRAEEARS